MFDFVIKGGILADGTGKARYQADIGIQNDRIVRIGKIDQAENLIDAADKLITPGFIDPHSHADCSVFLYPDCESYQRQGITTFVGGQCGDSNAPIFHWWARKYWEYDFWSEIDPFIYDPRLIQPADKVLEVVERKTGYRIQWKTFSQYARVIENAGLGCNMITLAGHSQIRADVMGLNQDRAPSPVEMDSMKEHIWEAFNAGAWGISTGRDYPPSAYADDVEIRELARFVKDLGGYYFTHWRRTGIRIGTPTRPDRLAGIREALEVALHEEIKTQISHLAAGFEIYPENPEMDAYAAKITLRMIDDYIQRGADVAFDVIPGRSGGICINPHLISLFAPWVREAGSIARFIANLGAKDYCERLYSIIKNGEWYAINPKNNPSWDCQITVIKSEKSRYIGASLWDIALDDGGDSIKTALRLLREDPLIYIRRDGKSDEEVYELLRHPRANVCTDTYAFDLRGLYGNEGEYPEILPHPHTYCAFPKSILEYPLDTIEATIRRVTGAPAEFLGICDRGILRENAFADIVILNMDELATKESYLEPRVYPHGVEYVFINGVPVVTPKGCSGKRPGRLLRK